ncbi:haloacid dehalogenase-like hydrolase [Diaporthe helianthi]|uniref:Haloacid dehalogenase-like hydrolase n=1 Tax=Diaporthe helianthi TaxID=158607 RepID=A0A2P5IDI4_DIAHE|nr:haloacid dehalogenase-like hydrolase [Diaporthe helianthi]
MLPEDQPVETILKGIDAEMGSQPKVILFDIGGVVVVSPFQSILDYELSLGIPPGWVNYSISKMSPNGFWHRLERGEIPLDTAFIDGFSKDLHRTELWEAFYKDQRAREPRLPDSTPPVPDLDAEFLFNDMMSSAVAPDPWVYPALKNLKASGKYILAALSNTIIFPPGHKLHRPDLASDPIRSMFDVFISSAHVGLRKPDPKIYELAVREVDKFARENRDSSRGKELGWSDGVKAADVLFLDDIGQNLKAASKAGFRTIKVNLGRAFEAVEELESITGLALAGDHPKVPIKPKIKKSIRAKI